MRKLRKARTRPERNRSDSLIAAELLERRYAFTATPLLDQFTSAAMEAVARGELTSERWIVHKLGNNELSSEGSCQSLTNFGGNAGWHADPIGTSFFRLQTSGIDSSHVVNWARNNHEQFLIEPDLPIQVQKTPNDPSLWRLYGLHNSGQSGGTTDADLDALEAWEITTGSRDVVIGVIDSGVDITHPDLAANIWVNPGETPNNGIDDDGNMASGWIYSNGGKPANIREQDSETPWLTREMIRFLKEGAPQRDRPWMCHLSYIKPHWPYIVPAPYHDMYGPNSFVPVVRDDSELVDQNPVYAAFSGNVIGTAFRQDAVREAALGAYMGLIKQIDDQMGLLFAHLRESGQLDNSVIVITSDHGDYLGDHWLGEKDLFHDASVRVPMIIYDPSPDADATRGTVSDALVESIDLLPTFVEIAGGTPRDEWLEGRSLMPLLRGDAPADAALRRRLVVHRGHGGAAGGAAATAMTLVDIERELTTHEPPLPTDFKRCAPPDG